MRSQPTSKVELGELGDHPRLLVESGAHSNRARLGKGRTVAADGALGSPNSTYSPSSAAATSAANGIGVAIVRFTPAPPLDVADGLLGWVDLRVGELLVVHGVAVRRTRNGAPALSWPAKDDRVGGRRSVVRPHGDAARLGIETAVFAELSRQGLVRP